MHDVTIIGSGPAGYTAAVSGCAAALDAQAWLSENAPQAHERARTPAAATS